MLKNRIHFRKWVYLNPPFLERMFKQIDFLLVCLLGSSASPSGPASGFLRDPARPGRMSHRLTFSYFCPFSLVSLPIQTFVLLAHHTWHRLLYLVITSTLIQNKSPDSLRSLLFYHSSNCASWVFFFSPSIRMLLSLGACISTFTFPLSVTPRLPQPSLRLAFRRSNIFFCVKSIIPRLHLATWSYNCILSREKKLSISLPFTRWKKYDLWDWGSDWRGRNSWFFFELLLYC